MKIKTDKFLKILKEEIGTGENFWLLLIIMLTNISFDKDYIELTDEQLSNLSKEIIDKLKEE